MGPKLEGWSAKHGQCPNCGMYAGHHTKECWNRMKNAITRSLAEYALSASAPVLRDRNAAERKAEPLHSGVLMYFPDALAAVARLSKAGNDKHNPGEPLHWARGKSTDQMDCAARHSLTPDHIDPETGETELTAQAWRTLAQLQLQQERLLKEKGIKPYSGVVP